MITMIKQKSANSDDSLWDKLWYGHNDLHDGVHVAAVAEVVDAGETRPMKWLQLTAGLLQDAPLPDSLVHVQLQLSHRLLSLQTATQFTVLSVRVPGCQKLQMTA